MKEIVLQHTADTSLTWLSHVLSERFGSEIVLTHATGSITLSVAGVEGNIYFDRLEGNFAKSSSDIPFTSWDAEREGWLSVLRLPLPAPGVTELPEPLIEKIGNGFTIHYDILGLTYWMLTRLEEIGRTDLDSHGRFPATSSHALKHGYLDRPVVDEWFHVLGQVMRVTWPEITIKQPKFRM